MPQIAHVGGVPLLIRFRGPHGEQQAVAVAGVGHVPPFKRAHFRPPPPAHEQQAGDHGVESAPALRRDVGFDAPAVRAGPFDGSRPTRGRSLPRRGRAGRRAWPETGRRRRPGRRLRARGPPQRSCRGRRLAGRRQPGRPRRVGAATAVYPMLFSQEEIPLTALRKALRQEQQPPCRSQPPTTGSI